MKGLIIVTVLSLGTSGIYVSDAAAVSAEPEIIDYVSATRVQVDAEVTADDDSKRADVVAQDFLIEQARSGVLWDAEEVSAATLGATDVAFSTNVDTTLIETAVVEQADGEESAEIAIAAQMEGAGDLATP